MGTSNRDGFSIGTIRELELAAGTRCSKPDCQADTTARGSDGISRIGIAAHITAARPGGARFNPELTSEQRRSTSNGIWLCQNHAREIDVDEDRYPVQLLMKWKNKAENRRLGFPIHTPSIQHGPLDERFLGQLPGPVRREMQELWETDSELVRAMAPWVANPSERDQNIQDLYFTPPSWLVDSSSAWELLGQLAEYHRFVLAPDLYRRAADVDPSPTRRLILQVLQFHTVALTDIESARSGIEGLKSAKLSEKEAKFLSLVLAVFDQQIDEVVKLGDEVLGLSERTDRIAQSYKGQALAIEGRLDDAIRCLEGVASSANDGLNLQLAETYLLRGVREDAKNRLSDCTRARTIAIQARDQRRKWGGKSGEAALLAAKASAAIDDWEGVVLLGSETAGEATTEEGRTPELAELVGASLLFLYGDDEATSHVAAAASTSGRAWLRGIQLGRDFGSRHEAVGAFNEAVENASGEIELERGLRGLASLGVHPLPRLAELAIHKPHQANALDALASYRAEPNETSLAILRKEASNVRFAAAILSQIEVERGNPHTAAQIALDAATRFDDPGLVLCAVVAVADVDPGEATRIARVQVDGLSATSPVRKELRRTLLSLAQATGDITQIEHAARAALADGVIDKTTKWALVYALFGQARADEAWDKIVEFELTPDTEDEARVYLLCNAAVPKPDWRAALAVIDLFSSSHDVVVTGLVLYLTMDSKGMTGREAEEISQLYGDRLQRFSSAFPDSDAIYRINIDFDDPDRAIEQIKASLPEHNEDLDTAIANVADAMSLGRLPVGACAAVLRTGSLALQCSGTRASVPSTSAGSSFARDVKNAKDALDAELIIDMSVLASCSLVPDLWESLVGSASRLIMVTSQQAEIREFARQPQPVGYFSSTKAGIGLADVAEDDRRSVAERKVWMVKQLGRVPVETTVKSQIESPLVDLEARGSWAHAMHLAAASGRILVADDPGLVGLALYLGFKAVSSLSVVVAGVESGRSYSDGVEHILARMVEACATDIPLNPAALCKVLQDLGWPPAPSLQVLSRPIFWQQPQALDAYDQICSGLIPRDRAMVAEVVSASVTGALRAVVPAVGPGFAAPVVVRLVLAWKIEPSEMPNVLSALRRSWRVDGDVLISLIRALVETLEEMVSSHEATRYVSWLCSHLDESDRHSIAELLLSRPE